VEKGETSFVFPFFSIPFQDSQSVPEVFAAKSVQANSIAVAKNDYQVLAKKCKGCPDTEQLKPRVKARVQRASSLPKAGAKAKPQRLHIAVAFAVAVVVVLAVAIASRYPKASALGLSHPSDKMGFSPWGSLPSHPQHSLPTSF
jgi:hypothetical protein